jgi:hypothetical protein
LMGSFWFPTIGTATTESKESEFSS